MIFRSPYPDIVVPDTPLHTLILSRAAELAEKPALVDGPSGRTLTYGQLAGASRLIASSLAQRGFKKGDVFAVYSPNIPEYALPILAVSMLGGACTGINPLYTVEELAFQLNDTGATFLVTIPLFMEKAIEAAKRSKVREIFVYGEAEGATPFVSLLAGDGQIPDVQINPYDDVVAIPYSSGTTGLPKGVMLTHRSLVANILQAGYPLPTNDDDKVLAVLPFYHIYGLTIILGLSLFKGSTIVTLPRFDLEQALRIMQDQGITVAPLVPPIIVALAKHPIVDQFDLSKIKFIGSGAAPLGDNVERAATARVGTSLVQGYGMTETSAATHINPVDKTRSGSVGVLLPSTLCKIVDLETGADLGPHQQGEICVRGPQIMKGYLNRLDATRNMIDFAGWLHTGDVGYADDDGYFFVVDRVKELIKYNGLQVAPAELEAVLLANPAIADAAVIPVPDESAGELPKAFVVLKGETTPDEIMAFVAERVAPHKKVRLVEIVETIPKSASGKILRRLLIEQERAKVASAAAGA